MDAIQHDKNSWILVLPPVLTVPQGLVATNPWMPHATCNTGISNVEIDAQRKYFKLEPAAAGVSLVYFSPPIDSYCHHYPAKGCIQTNGIIGSIRPLSYFTCSSLVRTCSWRAEELNLSASELIRLQHGIIVEYHHLNLQKIENWGQSSPSFGSQLIKSSTSPGWTCFQESFLSK